MILNMKPYGRAKKVKGGVSYFGNNWKRDYHVHDRNHRKVGNWWEDFWTILTRSAIKRNVQRQIDEELYDD
jgi:hypothetical protein